MGEGGVGAGEVTGVVVSTNRRGVDRTLAHEAEEHYQDGEGHTFRVWRLSYVSHYPLKDGWGDRQLGIRSVAKSDGDGS